jgi:hypothetical protein
MEDSTIRKIKVVVRDKDGLALLLNQLENVKGEITVEFNVGESKTNYSLLATSPSVLDWDFITAEKSRQEDFVVGVTGEGRDDVTKTDSEFLTLTSQIAQKPAEGILKGIEPGDWNGLTWRIESVWRAALKSPAVLFQSDFFWKVLEQVSQFNSPTPEHAILVKLSEARWSGWEWKDVEEDITQILNIEWKNGMGKKSLTELSRTIYGRN